jgi:hypothetical protein
MTQSWNWFRMNAIRLPFGDQEGFSSCLPAVSRRGEPPAGVETQISFVSSPASVMTENAIFFPSRDQDGSAPEGKLDAIRVTGPEPSPRTL